MTDVAMHPDTLAVHAGREDLAALGVHALPIDLSTTNPLPDIEAGGASYDAMAGGGRPDPAGGLVYARLWNPTVGRFEDALAELEHAPAAVAFASGMAAVTAGVLAAVTAERRHVVAVRPLYGGTDHLLASGLLGTRVSYCTESEVAQAIRPDTALVVAETPANPTLELVDIAALVAAAGDVPVLVDNTFATPVLQNPIDHGAAYSLHSATKYLGGHGDVVGGVVACRTEELAGRLRSVRAITGALLHPMAAYLLHRGLPTLPTRVRSQQSGARRLAEFLAAHPAVRKVHYPGADGDPRGLIGRQLRGTGAMIAIELAGGYAAARAVCSAVRIFTHAVSLGGVDSLIEHPAALTHRPVVAGAKPSQGIVRLSVGLEDPDDLIADLAQALAAADRAYPTFAAASAGPGGPR